MKRRVISVLIALALLLGFTGVTAQAATEAEIAAAIDKGLEYLDNTQNVNGYWGNDVRVARTGLAVLKFETHAHFLGLDPLDPAYEYSGNVELGLNYLFSMCYDYAISTQPAGDPDTNGNGIGVQCYDDYPVYETSIALMAISASGDGDRVVPVGPQATRKYKEVAQDMVDYLAFAQHDSGNARGGWRYVPNGGADNSVSGYATIGLSYAHSPHPWGFSSTVPAFVYSEMNYWIDYIQNDTNGGSGYDFPTSWVNILKTGNLLSEMGIYGDTQATVRVQNAIAYMVAHWNDPNQDPGWKGTGLNDPHCQACFTMMKGFMALGIETIDGIDWYDEMSTLLVNAQQGDGSWPWDYWGDPQLATCWALLALEKAAPPALILDPPFDINPAYTSHTITAIYKKGVEPQQGIEIEFEVIAGPNTGKADSDVTDGDGKATFTYTGDGGVGTDTIKATAVDQAGAPLISATATKEWGEGEPPAIEVGGDVSSVSRLSLLAPWIGLAAAALAVAGVTLVLRRRRI